MVSKVYVLMFRDEIFEKVFYIDESEIDKRIVNLNKGNPLGPYWYETLHCR